MRVFICLLFLAGCGDDSSVKEYPATPVVVQPVDFAEAKAVIDEQCANAGCHAGDSFIKTAEAFKASSAKARIKNRSMPKRSGPNYNLYSAAKKKILLDFLN